MWIILVFIVGSIYYKIKLNNITSKVKSLENKIQYLNKKVDQIKQISISDRRLLTESDYSN